MEILNIPTDNLYKFKAISGLVLIIFCLSIVVFLQKDKYENMIALAEKNDLNIADSIRAMDSITYLEKLLVIEKRDFEARFAISYDSIILITINSKQDVKPELKNILLIELKLKRLKSNIEYERAKLHIDNQVENIKVIIYKLIYVFLFLIVLLGVYLCLFGFAQWYNRTQKYYDRKLKKDSLLEFNYIEKSNALKEIHRIYYQILPVKSNKDQDWDDALEIIALRFPQIKNDLENFREKYSSVLTDDINNILTESINICNTASSYTISELNDLANNIYNNQKELIEKIDIILKKEME